MKAKERGYTSSGYKGRNKFIIEIIHCLHIPTINTPAPTKPRETKTNRDGERTW
jgi:hypothetical protein